MTSFLTKIEAATLPPEFENELKLIDEHVAKLPEYRKKIAKQVKEQKAYEADMAKQGQKGYAPGTEPATKPRSITDKPTHFIISGEPDQQDLKSLMFPEWPSIRKELVKCVVTEKCDAVFKQVWDRELATNKIRFKYEKERNTVGAYEMQAIARQLTGICQWIRNIITAINMGQFNPDPEKRIEKLMGHMDWTAWASDDAGVSAAQDARMRELNALIEKLPPKKADAIRKKIEKASKEAHGE